MADRVESVFNLLEVFCKNNYPLGITTLSNMLLEGKSSIFQKIKILEKLEYIEKDEHTDKYVLTTKLLELMNISMSSYYQRTNVHKYLKKISDTTGECTYFGLRNKKNRIVYVDRYASENAMAVYTNIGDSPLPHCTAHGKALIAYLTVEQIEETIHGGMEKFTEKTLVTKDALFDELRKIREQGYAYDDEERMVGVRCVAAPVFNSHKEIIGAIGVSGLLQNMPYETMHKHALYIKDIADHMSVVLGNELVY
jgi:DNA-binding IclR family transcriptional regulator